VRTEVTIREATWEEVELLRETLQNFLDSEIRIKTEQQEALEDAVTSLDEWIKEIEGDDI